LHATKTCGAFRNTHTRNALHSTPSLSAPETRENKAMR
jgi:hypothetical protein